MFERYHKSGGRAPFLGLLALAIGLLGSRAALSEPIPVELVETDDGWRLMRGGEPYFIRGAGGDFSLRRLAAAGANSIRTWDAENVRGSEDAAVLLDEAHALDMTVTLGIWLGHERHGFNYNDPEQVARQLQRARSFVERYRDHPALLMWGIGNEMEGFDDGGSAAVWSAVNEVAAMVKELDPHHPTMTVTTFVHGERIDFVHRLSPAIDVHGVNAYGGAALVHEKLRDANATKPFVITEFGPPGPWEVGSTDWGAPLEPSSTEKAEHYRQSYVRGVVSQSDLALGSYAFLWGHKMESTPTWFGMWLEDGRKLAAVDTMTELWSGKPPANLAPAVTWLNLEGPASVDPGTWLKVRAQATDPENGPLSARWELRADSIEPVTGGDYRPQPTVVQGAVLEADLHGARVRMPKAPGAYRLYYFVHDDARGAATANIPLRVNGEARPMLPFPVYEEGFENMPWAPSGWMGAHDQLSLDGQSVSSARRGNHGIRLRYEGNSGWVGVAWQHPANNWGEQMGGIDVTGASALELWARGQYGGENIEFGVGLLDQDKRYPDSSISTSGRIVLSHEWQRYTLPLKGRDLSSLKTGFVITLVGRQTPVTVHLDDIRFIR